MSVIKKTFNKSAEYLLISDIHWDNPKCDRELLKNHLDEAKRRGAGVLINGDMFCLMQGKGDPRRSKDDIRQEHNKANYLDAIVTTAVEWFEPYKDVIQFAGYGNHETSIIKYQETDILRRFADLFNHSFKPDKPIQVGGYGGFIVFHNGNVRGRQATYVIKYYHGSGGGGVVTKGVIQNNRMMANVSGVDVIWQGHIHELYHHLDITEYFDRSFNRPLLRHVNHIRTSTYKEEYGDGAMGWHIERGQPAKPLGGYWMKLTNNRVNDKTFITADFTQCTKKY